MEKYPIKYCQKCGSKMLIEDNMGDEVCSISSLNGEHYKYDYDMFDEDTGHRRKIYTCPNWKIVVEKGFLFNTIKKVNGHDRFRI